MVLTNKIMKNKSYLITVYAVLLICLTGIMLTLITNSNIDWDLPRAFLVLSISTVCLSVSIFLLLKRDI